MKQLKLGIIGLGRAGYTMHLRELKGKEDMFKIVAVCDCEVDRVENMNKLYGCKTYTRVEDIVLDPDVDVIDIATRSCDHFKHAKTALDAGKTVFLEKPMCTNYEDARALFEYAERNGEKKLFIRHNRRFEAKFMQINKIIESGIIGEAYYIKRSVGGFERRSDWQTLSQYGGGQLLNWGPHIVDQSIQFCGGDYTKLSSYTRQVAASGDCEDFVRASFEGINGRLVEMEISGGTAIPRPEYVVYGTKGAILDKGETLEITRVEDGYVFEPQTSSPFTPDGAVFAYKPPVPFIKEEVPCETNPLDHTWAYLYEAVVNGKDYPIKSEEALMVMKAISEIKAQNRR